MLVFSGAPARIYVTVFPAKTAEFSVSTETLASERTSEQVFEPADQTTDPYIGCASEAGTARPQAGLS